MDHVLTHAKQTTGAAAPRLSPLEAFVAWIANLIRTITGMKRRTVFPTNWRDHWEGLRQLEWCQHQIMAFCAQQVLAGKSLNDDLGFELIMDVPDTFGGRCPSTPQEMKRRFILQQRFKLDPNKYTLRHIQRIARRAGIALTIDAGGCPHRLAALATSPSLRLEEESHRVCGNHRSLSSSGALRRGRWRATSSSRDGGGSHGSLVQARGPPLRLPIAHCRLPQRASD